MVCVAVDVASAEKVVGDAFRADLQALTRDRSRVIGSEGCDRAGAYIEETARKLPNVELKTHEFPVMVPVTRSATLDLGGGRVERVYPFWPAQVRVCSTPADGITAKLVYAGECRYEQLRPASLDGQIAVVEASAGSRWVEASYVGARAILILGTAQTSWSDLSAHDLRVPVNLPRFYVPPGALADELRAGKLSEATLKATVTWQRSTARNYYALVRPRVKQPQGWTQSQPPAALMFSVRYDATSLVPDLAPGAGQAIQAAAGLALLRDLSNQAWSRPVVVFFSGADGIQNLGTRNMLLALAEAPQAWREEQASLDAKIASAQGDLDRARFVAGDISKLSFRGDRGLVDRMVKIIETDLALEQDQLFRLRSLPRDELTGAQRQRMQELEARQRALNRLKYLLRQAPAELAGDEHRDMAQGYLQRAIARLGGDPNVEGLLQQYRARKEELNQRIALYQWLADATGREREPDKRRQTATRLIELLVGLDLTDRGQRVGPMFYGFFQRASGMPQILGYRDWLSGVERAFNENKAGSEWWGSVRDAVNIETLSQGRLPATYLAGPLATPGEIAQAWGVPGLSMITLNDLRLRRDTPADTLDRIDVTRILPQLDAVIEVFRRACDDPRFRGPTELRRQEVTITGQVLSQSPGRPVPDLPRDGFLATYYHAASKDKQIPMLGSLPWALGVRRNEVRQTDAEGNYLFEGLPKLRADRLEGIEKQQADMQYFDMHVYRMDPGSGAIVATTDLGEQAKDAKRVVDIKQDYKPVRSVVFNCEEFTLTRLYDPRFLQTLGEVLPLDARRNAEPQRFNMMMADQMLAGFVEPGTPLHLLIRYGRVGNRLVLLNMGDERRDAEIGRKERETSGVESEISDEISEISALPSSSSDLLNSASRRSSTSVRPLGYTPRQLNNLPPLALAASRDFYRLDDERLADYRRAGVSSSLIDSLHSEARQQIEASEASRRADNGVGLIRNATGAWANEARVYNAAQDMARDVIRAAIFLLMLCVPFAFCMERLIIATPNVYRQIAGIAGIFAAMTLALWAFHPAFRISASPLIIILAFAIILMSIVVILVVYQKFDSELKRISTGRGTAGTAGGVGSAGVLMSAVLLGIANMRKRKFRTLLTSLTIVLITFAVLCFTSTTRYVGTAVDATGLATSHPGILLRQRGFRPMPEIVPDQLRAVVADPKLDVRGVNVVERWWAVSTSEPNEKYNVTGSAGTIALPAILGLTPGESRLSRIADVIGPAKFSRLEKGEEHIIYLAKPNADALDVAEGDTIRLGGIDLAVAGVFDAGAFDRDVLTLSGEPIAPLKFIAGQLDAGGRKLDDTESESLDVSAAGELGGTYEHLPSTDFAIVPASVARKLYKSTLRSVGFRLDDEKAVKRVSDELARRFSLAQFAGYDDGVRMVAASNLASVSGAAEVAIPLMIAGLIIFNTMMGSIAERRREIHVYTSLGLAPLHVGALFVAEAMTYGLIGTVFGYIIGQGAGTVLLKLGWLGSVTLNYSGTSAMMTMGLILFIVLLSALIPARLASKIAAPSIERNWRVPLPQNGTITAELPFTINKTAADGALAYLAEWFDDHREGNIGKFASARIEPFASDDGRSHGLRTSVWLTPFDLGVRQQLELVIHPGAFPDIYEVQVKLSRQSGDDGSWYRMNRPFLTELRKQFLQWRSLSPARMTQYVEQSRALAFTTPAEAQAIPASA